ncbi:hypothetical protein [Lysobacter olei]
MLPRRLLSALVLSVLLLGGCASTHRVILAPPRPAIAVEQVKVYHVAPKRFEEIARLESSSAIGFGTAGQTDAAILRLRREAAKLGANGVLLLGVGSIAPPVSVGVGTGVHRSHVGIYGGVGIPTTQRQAVGVAIHVIEE